MLCHSNVLECRLLNGENSKGMGMEISAVKIRKASLADLEKLLEFEQGVIAAERPFAKNLKAGDIAYYDVVQLIADGNTELLVAEFEGKLIGSGYATIREAKPYNKHPRYSYLGFMYVEPGYRGKGVNKLIIDELAEWSRSRGVYELRLDVYDSNQAAIRAYEKVGFSKNLVEMRVELNH